MLIVVRAAGGSGAGLGWAAGAAVAAMAVAAGADGAAGFVLLCKQVMVHGWPVIPCRAVIRTCLFLGSFMRFWWKAKPKCSTNVVSANCGSAIRAMPYNVLYLARRASSRACQIAVASASGGNAGAAGGWPAAGSVAWSESATVAIGWGETPGAAVWSGAGLAGFVAGTGCGAAAGAEV